MTTTATTSTPKRLSFDNMVELQSDGGLKLKQKEYLAEGAIPVVDQGAVLVGGYTNDERLRYQGPLPVVVFGDHTRNFKLIDFPFAVGADGVKLLAPKEGVNARYLYYMLLAVELPDRGYSRHMQFLKKTELPYAPLPEQRRIVEAIERQLGRLDAAVSRLQAAKAKLKRYKQAVLKAAVDEAIEEAEGNTVRLDEVADLCLGKMLDRQKNKGTPHPYLRNINVRWDAFDTEDLHQMPFEHHEHERYGLDKGDLVVCEGGEPGRCAVWDGSIPDMKIQKALHRVRCGAKADPSWVMYSLLFSCWSGAIAKYYTGTTIKHLTGKSLSSFELVLPSIKTQRRLVAQVQEAFDRTGETDSTLDAQLLQATRLRQAVLKRAFEGRLV